MSKKFNNKYLLIALAVLILLFVFVKFYRSVKTEKTLKTEIVQIDTAKVSKILLYPSSEKGQELAFTRHDRNWKVSNGKILAETEKSAVKNLLATIHEIKSKRLASRTKDKWAEYQVTDSAATRIRVFEGEKENLNLYVGKFTYQQVNDPNGGYGRGGVIGTSYVRLANENEVYAVDGFLTFSFNQPFNRWRDQSFIRLNKSDVTKLTFRYPSDSSFVVERNGKKWMIDNQLIDSVKFSDYLSMLSNKKASNFEDGYTPIGNSLLQLIIEGNNMSSITVDAFTKDNNGYVISSSQNPKSWFSSDRKGLLKDIFRGKRDLMTLKKK